MVEPLVRIEESMRRKCAAFFENYSERAFLLT